MEGRLPVGLQDAQTATRDGPSRDLGPYGRWYTGPNGLEIRLNNRGTLLAITQLETLAQGIAAFGPGLQAKMQGTPDPRIRMLQGIGLSAALAAQLLKNQINDILENELLRNTCLGVTVPKGDPLRAFMRIMAGIPGVAKEIASVRMWAEACDPSKPILMNNAATPAPAPSANPGDTAPATRAEAVPGPTRTKTTTPRAQPTRHPATPAETHVDMGVACRQAYGSDAIPKYESMSDENSWYCEASSGSRLGGVDLYAYCPTVLEGSRPTNEAHTAFGWRCTRK